MLAKRIKMYVGCSSSQQLHDIDEIYISGCINPGYFKREALHDYLLERPNTIQVNIHPHPNLIPVTSLNGEKYVRSAESSSQQDNLLLLPRN